MKLEKLTNNVYYLGHEKLNDRPVLGYVLGEKFSIMVDGGNSENHLKDFLEALRLEGLPEPSYCLITHWHWDHTFGMDFFKGACVVSKKTNVKLEELKSLVWTEEELMKRVEMGEEIDFAYKAMKVEYENFEDIRLATGDIIFNEEIYFDMGGINCKMFLAGGPHEEDSSLILVEEEKILFAGDAHSGDYYNNKGAIDPIKMENYIDLLKSIDFKTYVLGHDEPMSKEDIIKVLEGVVNRI